MIGSILPFLAVLSDPSRIQSEAALSWAFNSFSFKSNYAFLVALGLGSLAVILIANILQVSRIWVIQRFTMMRSHSLSYRLLARYLWQPYEFFLDDHSGRMSTQILSEAQQFVQSFLRPAAEVFASGITTIAIVGLLFLVNPIVAMWALALLGGAYLILYWLIRGLAARLGRVRAEANRARYRAINEALGGIKDTKLLGIEQHSLESFHAPSLRMAEANTTVNFVGEAPHYLMQALAFGGMILLCIILMSNEESSGGTPVATIVPILGVFAFAGQRLMPELSKLYRGATQLRYGTAAVNTLYADLVQGEPGEKCDEIADRALGLKHSLQLQNVCFRYPNAERLGLEGIDLTIRAGERIGIVGTTGAGKTTLADIILGLLRPTSGTILVDGIKVTTENVYSWRRSVGYVPQEIFLNDASIAENIALGASPKDIDEGRLREVAQIAQIAHLIDEELPDGYRTTLGERGVRLSGGQRQRVGIARALYRHTELIVFDEATSALDNMTENEVMDAINAMPGKTVIMIAHRLSTVRLCDRLVVLEAGRIVGLGNWDDLRRDSVAFQKIAGALEKVPASS